MPNKKYKTLIVWMRQDLRVTDDANALAMNEKVTEAAP